MDSPSRAAAQSALTRAYDQLSQVVARCDDAAFLLPSRCAGWAVCDVLYHQMLDARRALRAYATPSAGPADCDDISYWRPWGADGEYGVGGPDAAQHARHVRIAASAYSPRQLVWEWSETAGAACRAAAACPHELVATQGHILRTADFTATLAVEAAVHFLDLTVSLPDAPQPDPEPLALARRVLTGLLGGEPAMGWDDATLVLKGTGRLPLSEAERSALGSTAARFPLFG